MIVGANLNTKYPPSEIGERIKTAAGLTRGIKWLAKEIGTYEANLHRYIRGETKISVESLLAISHATGTTLEWLATGKGEMLLGSFQSEAKKLLVDMWFDFRKNEEEKFWGRFYPVREPSEFPQEPEEISDEYRIIDIDDEPNMSIAGTIKKFALLYNRGRFGMGLVPDWVFTFFPTLAESEFEKWVREGLKTRIEAGEPDIQEIIPYDLLPDLGDLLNRLNAAVEKVYSVHLKEINDRIRVQVLRVTIYPTLIRLGANNTRLPEIEEIESLLRLAIKLGSIPPPQNAAERPTINPSEKHNLDHQQEQ